MKTLRRTQNWKSSDITNNGNYLINGDENQYIAEVQEKEDARLIAAAPELLEACKVALKELASIYRWPIENRTIKTLENAIAKSEGK